MQIEDFRRLASRRGLVSMLFVQGSTPYAKGQTAGFDPATAKQYYDNRIAVPKALADKLLPRFLEPQAPSAPPPQASLVDQRDSIIIPEDWADPKRDAIYRISLASKIEGIEAAAIATDENARVIIEGEIARRAGRK